MFMLPTLWVKLQDSDRLYVKFLALSKIKSVLLTFQVPQRGEFPLMFISLTRSLGRLARIRCQGSACFSPSILSKPVPEVWLPALSEGSRLP